MANLSAKFELDTDFYFRLQSIPTKFLLQWQFDTAQSNMILIYINK